MAILKSPYTYVGRKYYTASRIVQELNKTKHDTYLEAFAGSGAVLLKKEPVKCEIYNDLDGDLTNFWMQLRDNADQLQQKLETLPYSKPLFDEWKKDFECADPLERAVKFYYIIRNCFSGKLSSLQWSCSNTGGNTSNNCAQRFKNAIETFPELQKRFRNVQIHCLDAVELIKRCDSDHSAIYADPPYFEEGKSCYRNGKAFDEYKHWELAETLNKLKRFALISYYPHPNIEKYYKGWRIINYNHVQMTKCTINKDTKPRHEELMIMNFDENGNKII